MQICKKLLHTSNAGAHIYPLMQRENEDKHFTQTTEAKKHGVLEFSFEHSTCLTCSSHFSTFTAVLRRLCGIEILTKHVYIKVKFLIKTNQCQFTVQVVLRKLSCGYSETNFRQNQCSHITRFKEHMESYEVRKHQRQYSELVSFDKLEIFDYCGN